MSPLDLWIWLPPSNFWNGGLDTRSKTCRNQKNCDSLNDSVLGWTVRRLRRTLSRSSTDRARFLWFFGFLVLFLLLRVCDGAKIKHAYGGSGSYLMSNTYPQMRKDILSKEDDFVAKGKSKFPIC
ncbi:hypothetical protein YQE_05126, partial [Dendroctonus ponderosae]